MKKPISDEEKRDQVIIATTGKKGRINFDELIELSVTNFKDDPEPDNSLDYFNAIDYNLEMEAGEGFYISKADKIGLISDLKNLRDKVNRTLEAFQNFETFEGE